VLDQLVVVAGCEVEGARGGGASDGEIRSATGLKCRARREKNEKDANVRDAQVGNGAHV
jgi:hypothetical protein